MANVNVGDGGREGGGVDSWEDECFVMRGLIRGDGERLLSKLSPTFS